MLKIILVCNNGMSTAMMAKKMVPVVSMNPSHYGLMNAKGVIDDVKKIMKERK